MANVFLSVENFQLLVSILNITTEAKSKMLYHIMNFINSKNSGLSVLENNKLVINLYSNTTEPDHPLEKLDLPESILRSYINKPQRNNPNLLVNADIGYMQGMYRKTNEYYQNYEMPDGVREDQLIIEKSDSLKQLLAELFNFYQREHIFVLDSRDRNHTEYPTAEDYRLNLGAPVTHIHTIQLLSAEVPKSGYIISEINNTVYFSESTNVILEGSIPIGNYTVSELVSALSTVMNSVGSSTYIVSNQGGLIKITSDMTGGDNIFTLKLNGGTEIATNGQPRTIPYLNNIGSTIGFKFTDLTGFNNYTGSSNIDISSVKNVFLTIDNLDTRIEIPMNGNIGQTIFYKDSNFTRHFYPNKRKISHLQIKWTDHLDNVYHFNGIEHSITLKFIGYNA